MGVRTTPPQLRTLVDVVAVDVQDPTHLSAASRRLDDASDSGQFMPGRNGIGRIVV
jgi:predicted outer membrane protein